MSDIGNRVMKKVTALLIVYAILVIASCAFWAWSACSKSRSNEERAGGDINDSADGDQMIQDAETVIANDTELPREVRNDVKENSQAYRNREVK